MTEIDPLPISLVVHTAFCERRTWLEAAGEQVPSVAIEQGIADHERVDGRQGERTRSRRSVAISHPTLGLTGRCDVLELEDDAVKLVEFKSAPLRRSYTVTPSQRMQLALQRLCLESADLLVSGQAVHFTTARRTVEVPLTQEDFENAVACVELTRQIVASRDAPDPLVDDPRCTRCSHASVCLPDERAGKQVRRRILVPDPGAEILHVTVPGSRVSLRKGRLIVSRVRTSLPPYPSNGRRRW